MKKSRTKYSKANFRFSQLVGNIEKLKQLKIDYNNKKEKRIKQMLLIQAETEKNNSVDNIFIETEELYKFFSLTQINIQSDIAQQVYHSLKNRKYVKMHTKHLDNYIPFRLYIFRLYAPINLMPTSLAVCISCTETYDEGFSLNAVIFSDKNSTQDLMLHKKGIESLENGFVMMNNNIIKDERSIKIYEYNRVILNLLFYMNAFPENVINGVPSRAIIDENVIVADKKFTITKNTELFKKYELSPHLRRGHWRTFTSDYYTNKKGETIWIDPTFIKGEAFTVIEGGNNEKSSR